MQTIHDAEEPATMPYDSSQPRVQSLGSDEGSLILNELTVLCTTLSKKVEDLRNDLKQTKLTYCAAYTKLILRVKKLEHKDEGTSWIQEDADIQGKNISTASAIPKVSTAGVSTAKAKLSTVILEVSTAAENLVYIRRSAEKRKDQGKAIMKEDESVQTKTKKQLEQERLSHEEAIRLKEQINEEERQRIAKDTEITKQLQEEINTARQEQEKSDLEKALELKKYHAQQNRSFSKADVRKNMCIYLKNQEEYKHIHFKGMSYEGKEKEVLEEELKKLLVIVPVEEVHIEALQVKYPVIDWEVFTEESRSYWRIIRVGNHTEVYQVFEDILKRFDKDDLEKL
ncbi:hypothetical protein Tco_0993147 [Tanacetum coccineum]|uniref:Uncharacterized protein n=1 Tax=Tanacetum coccineum TaxID=301880 RepID=A0ABQ5F437_9ASTR